MKMWQNKFFKRLKNKQKEKAFINSKPISGVDYIVFIRKFESSLVKKFKTA